MILESAARPAMIKTLDSFRSVLEDQGATEVSQMLFLALLSSNRDDMRPTGCGF